MKKLFFCASLLIATISQLPAQSTDAQAKQEIDSLKKLFRLAKQDTDKVRLRCQIGTRENNIRISYWDSLLTDARKSKTTFYECKIYESRAHAYDAQGQMKNAIASYESAIAIAEQKGYKPLLIQLIFDLESIYARQLDRKKSLAMCYKGLKIAEEINDKRAITDFYSSIARYYFSSGEIKKALALHLSCLKLSREIHYDFGTSSALVDIGSDYVALNDKENATIYYLESKKYADVFRGTVYEAQIYNSVGAAYRFMKQYDSAYYYTYKGYEIVVNLNSNDGMASMLASLAGISYDRGNFKLAKTHALNAAALVKKSGFVAEVPLLYDLIKRIYIQEGDYKSALETYEYSVMIRDSLSNENVRKAALEKAFNYDLEKKQNENVFLMQKNQIQTLRLNQNRYFLFGFTILFIVLSIIAGLYFRQNKFKSEYTRMQAEQRLLRSQMNPHFIFNSMNSIQQFIMSGQNRQAELYLSKFSRLLRDLLEKGNEEDLTLQDEMGILNGYLEIESLRFGESFQYEIKLDEKIDPQHTRIPYLVVQPFVENAIWHGLLPKDQDKKVIISFEPDSPGTIRCSIDDNGIGREASMKKKGSYKSKSLAIDFISQRIDLMRKKFKVNCSIEIRDKYDVNDQSTGTCVILVLPIVTKSYAKSSNY